MKGFQNFSLLSPPAPALLWERTALKMKQPVRLDALLWKRMKENGVPDPAFSRLHHVRYLAVKRCRRDDAESRIIQIHAECMGHAYFQMLFSRSASANPAITN